MLIKTWRFVTVLLVALVTGLAFAHVLERPAKMLYDANLYLTVQKTLYMAWGPPNVGGILEPAAIVATIILVFLMPARTPAFWLSLGAATALLLAFPIAFFLFDRAGQRSFSRGNDDRYSSQLDRATRQLGKRSHHPFRAAVSCSKFADPLCNS